MNNKLLKTTGFLYKVKKIFRSLLRKDRNDNCVNDFQKNAEKRTVPFSAVQNSSSLKQHLELDRNNYLLAEKLLLGEIGPSELGENVTEDMIEYFTKDIQEKRREIENIKSHIIEMRKELKDG